MSASAEVCSACRGTGWLFRQGKSGVVPCPHCRSAARARQLLRRAEIPPRYLDRGFEVYSIHNPKQAAARECCKAFVEAFPDAARGLLLAGPCGVGKTHLSVATLKAVLSGKLATGRFVDEAELFRRLHYSYDPNSAETERQVLRPLMDADLLVWDDLGIGRPTEWARETMRTVINYRYTNNKLTIFTTNRSVQPSAGESLPGNETGRVKAERNLEESVGRRLFSRIMEMCEIVEINGPDARTEIHKAGRDFQEKRRGEPGGASRSGARLVIPTGMIRCPHCRAARIDQQEVAPQKGAGDRAFIDVSCLCGGCNRHFLARFFPRRGSLEYPME